MKNLFAILFTLISVASFGQFTKLQLYNGVNTKLRQKPPASANIASMMDSVVKSMPVAGSGLTAVNGNFRVGGVMTVAPDFSGAVPFRVQMTGIGGIALQTTYNQTTSGQFGIILGSTLLGTATAGNPVVGTYISSNLRAGTNNQTLMRIHDNNSVFNANGMTGVVGYGYYYNPTINGTIDHYAMALGSGRAVIGGLTSTNNSILLDLQSTTQALAVPRVTNVASVTTPLNGMVVYDVALDKWRFREGNAWVGIGTGGSSAIGVVNTIQTTNGSGTFTDSGILAENVSGSEKRIGPAGAGNSDFTIKNIGGGQLFNFETTTGNAILSPKGGATSFVIRGIGTLPSVVLATSTTNSGLIVTSSTASSGDIDVNPQAATYRLRLSGGSPGASAAAGGPIHIVGGAGGSGNQNGGDAYISGGAKSGTGLKGNTGLNTAGSGSFGGGAGVVFQSNADVNPSSNPTAGFLMYSDTGVPTFRTATGEIINLKSVANVTISTGTAVQFDEPKLYGTGTAETGNFTLNTTGLIPGLTQFVRHNNGTAPTFSSEYKIISGAYATSVDNYIFMYAISSTLVLVTIAQGL